MSSSGELASGGSISVLQCDAANGTCSFAFESAQPAEHLRCQAGTELYPQTLKLTSATDGTVTLLEEGREVRCAIRLRLEKGRAGPTLTGALEGVDCGNFCTSSVPYFVERYPLRSRAVYPDVHGSACFVDSGKAMVALCEEPAMQRLDDETRRLWDELDEVTEANTWSQRRAWFETMLSSCNSKADVTGCLTKAFTARSQVLRRLLSRANARAADDERKMSLPEASSKATRVISEVEGVYKNHFENGTVSGERFVSEDILEIVRVADDAVYFKTHLEFFNGHICGVSGIARLRKNGRFLYVDGQPGAADYCRLQLEPARSGMILHDDRRNPCRAISCGARGSYNGAKFSRKERRRIRYMARLKASPEYQEAMTTANLR